MPTLPVTSAPLTGATWRRRPSPRLPRPWSRSAVRKTAAAAGSERPPVTPAALAVAAGTGGSWALTADSVPKPPPLPSKLSLRSSSQRLSSRRRWSCYCYCCCRRLGRYCSSLALRRASCCVVASPSLARGAGGGPRVRPSPGSGVPREAAAAASTSRRGDSPAARRVPRRRRSCCCCRCSWRRGSSAAESTGCCA